MVTLMVIITVIVMAVVMVMVVVMVVDDGECSYEGADYDGDGWS